MRLTSKKLIDWANGQLMEMPHLKYKAVAVSRTRYTSDQYECGAAKLIMTLERTIPGDSLFNNIYLLCFYSLGELSDLTNSGHELCLKSLDDSPLLSRTSIDVRRKSTQ